MTEKTFDIKDHLVKALDAPITTLFRVEDISSAVLREVAYSIRNECLKLYEAGLTEPTQDFKDIDQFIEFMKTTGVPPEIRNNRDHLIKVLGAGFAKFIDVVDFGSPILRQVEYSWRFAGGSKRLETLAPFRHEPLPPCWSVMVDASFKRIIREMKRRIMGLEPYCAKRHPVPHIQPLPKQHVEMHCDTIYWSVEAPKNREGKRSCGLPFIREGVLKQSAKACAILGITIPQYWVETLVGHPAEIELVDSPAMREGAVSCDIRIHLTPSLVRISSQPCLEPFAARTV